jgi:hypothetical protein
VPAVTGANGEVLAKHELDVEIVVEENVIE